VENGANALLGWVPATLLILYPKRCGFLKKNLGCLHINPLALLVAALKAGATENTTNANK
jgi:hypothetical protein